MNTDDTFMVYDSEEDEKSDESGQESKSVSAVDEEENCIISEVPSVKKKKNQKASIQESRFDNNEKEEKILRCQMSHRENSKETD